VIVSFEAKENIAELTRGSDSFTGPLSLLVIGRDGVEADGRSYLLGFAFVMSRFTKSRVWL
jgi:hypothetical protein